MSQACTSPYLLAIYSSTSGQSLERPRRAVAFQKDEQMASKNTITNEDLISLTAKYLRGDGGAQKLSTSHLGLYASDNEVLKLKRKIEYQAKLFRESENDDIVVFLDEKEAKKELEEPSRSEKELSRKAFDLVMNHGYSSRGASDFMRDTLNLEIFPLPHR